MTLQNNSVLYALLCGALILVTTGSALAVPTGTVETLGTQGCCFIYEWRYSGNNGPGSEPIYFIKLRTGTTSANADTVYSDFGQASAGQDYNIPKYMWYRGKHGVGASSAGATFDLFHIGSGQCGGGRAQY